MKKIKFKTFCHWKPNYSNCLTWFQNINFRCNLQLFVLFSWNMIEWSCLSKKFVIQNHKLTNEPKPVSGWGKPKILACLTRRQSGRAIRFKPKMIPWNLNSKNSSLAFFHLIGITLAHLEFLFFCLSIVLGSYSFEFLTVSLHHFLTAYPLRPIQISTTTRYYNIPWIQFTNKLKNFLKFWTV